MRETPKSPSSQTKANPPKNIKDIFKRALHLQLNRLTAHNPRSMDEKTQNGPKPGMPPTMSSSDDLDQSRKRKLTSQDNHKTSSVDAMILTNPQSNDPPAGSKKKRGRPRKNGDQITNLEEATNNAGSEQGSTSIAWQSAVAPSTSAFKSFSGPRNYRAIAPEPSNYRATTPKPSAAEGSTPQETKAKTETRVNNQSTST